ncbi:MAG: HNH endonuclease signature motif containing protein [Acidimicrobiia bacterium]
MTQGNHVSSGPNRAMVDIRVDLETLTGLTENPGELAGFGPVIADIARRVTAEQESAEWRWTVVDDNNQVVDTGITTRRPTTAQKRHVSACFRCCVFPGCRVPAADCDLDHRVAVADGGPTTTCNPAPLCRHHHRVKHQASWKPTLQPNGDHTWLSRLGHTYTTNGQSP